MVEEERLTDTPRGKQCQRPSGLSAWQREITLGDARVTDFNFVECLYGPLSRVVVKIAIANFAATAGNDQGARR